MGVQSVPTVSSTTDTTTDTTGTTTGMTGDNPTAYPITVETIVDTGWGGAAKPNLSARTPDPCRTNQSHDDIRQTQLSLNTTTRNAEYQRRWRAAHPKLPRPGRLCAKCEVQLPPQTAPGGPRKLCDACRRQRGIRAARKALRSEAARPGEPSWDGYPGTVSPSQTSPWAIAAFLAEYERDNPGWQTPKPWRDWLDEYWPPPDRVGLPTPEAEVGHGALLEWIDRQPGAPPSLRIAR
jgi:hypothetical protein